MAFFLIKLLLAVASSATVQKVVLDQLETLAKRPDNTVDDRVVEEGTPALINGVWRQTWKTRSYNSGEVFEQFQRAKRQALDDVAKWLATRP